MTPDEDKWTQDAISRISGLAHALETLLKAHFVGADNATIASVKKMRDEIIATLKTSDIAPEIEMKHAAVVSPAIDAVEIVFDGFLRDREFGK